MDIAMTCHDRARSAFAGFQMWKSAITGGRPEDPLAIRFPGGARPGGHRSGAAGGGGPGAARSRPGLEAWAAGVGEAGPLC